MELNWNTLTQSLSQITVSSNPNNEPVTISGYSTDLKCIGVGTDAVVFQPIHSPSYAIKVYAKNKTAKVKIEEDIYKKLGASPYYPTCFGAEDRYLVLSYEQGITLFDCLLQGIHIPEQVIKDVEDAREYARQNGLNPRDMHLKNILLQNGRAKILDVSEYLLSGNDYRWEHLKKAYEEYYHLIDRKAVPLWLVENTRKLYNQRFNYFSSYDEFMKMALKLKTFIK